MEGLPKTRPHGTVALIFIATLYVISQFLFVPLAKSFFATDAAKEFALSQCAVTIALSIVLLVFANILARAPWWYIHKITVIGYVVFVAGIGIATVTDAFVVAGLIIMVAWLLITVGLVETCTHIVVVHQPIENGNAALKFVFDNKKAVERSRRVAARQNKE